MEVNTMLYLAFLRHKADMQRNYGPNFPIWDYQEFLRDSAVADAIRGPDGARFFEFLDQWPAD